MPVVQLVVLGLLGLGVLVYLAVLGMCRAASRADRGAQTPVAPAPDVLVDLDGTVLRGFTPPLGVRRVRGGPTVRQALVLDRLLDLDAAAGDAAGGDVAGGDVAADAGERSGRGSDR